MEFYHGNQLLLVFKSSGIVGLVTIIASKLLRVFIAMFVGG